jgi:YesN/AraC family two-component response regulator
MVDFQYLEEVAGKIKTNRQQLSKVENELVKVNASMHEIPFTSATESAFATMIGVEYHDQLVELEDVKGNLEAQKEMLVSTINNDIVTFITEITSSDLLIPLEPRPRLNEGNTIYTYRNGARFNNIFDILSELLGLSSPIVVKDVMLSSSEVVVKVSDEFEAKKKFINSMSEVQKALSIKKR